MINFTGLTTELNTLCRVPFPIPHLSPKVNNSSGEKSSPSGDYADGDFLYEQDVDRTILRKHVFANVWERSLDPRGVGSDEQSPDTWTIDWRQWPPEVPRLPAGLKIPVEFVPNAGLRMMEAVPLNSGTPQYYENLKGLLNTSQTSSVTVHPPALLFLHSKMGQLYSVRVRIKNVDILPRRIKIIPPRNTCFEVVWGGGQNTTVVPGLSVPISVNFKPNCNESLNDILFIAVEGDGGITVPLVSASVPPPILELEEWDCGCNVISNKRTNNFEIRNLGSAGRFWFLTEDEFYKEYIAFPKEQLKGTTANKQKSHAEVSPYYNKLFESKSEYSAPPTKSRIMRGNRSYANPFKIRPMCFKLLQNQKIKIKVKYTPKTAGLHYEKLAVMCDNGEVKWIAIKGMGIDPLSRSLIELQALNSWTGPPVDLRADAQCRYAMDLGDLLPSEMGNFNFRAVNRSCIPLYYFWSVRPMQLETDTTGSYLIFQNYSEGSIQPLEWEDYSNFWHDGIDVVDEQVNLTISPAQGLLFPKKMVDFNLSAPSPQQLGYYACVVSLFVEQANEESIKSIIPFIKELEEKGLNNIPIHFDDLKESMPIAEHHHHHHHHSHRNQVESEVENDEGGAQTFATHDFSPDLDDDGHRVDRLIPRIPGSVSQNPDTDQEYPRNSINNGETDNLRDSIQSNTSDHGHPMYLLKHGSTGHKLEALSVPRPHHHHGHRNPDETMPSSDVDDKSTGLESSQNYLLEDQGDFQGNRGKKTFADTGVYNDAVGKPEPYVGFSETETETTKDVSVNDNQKLRHSMWYATDRIDPETGLPKRHSQSANDQPELSYIMKPEGLRVHSEVNAIHRLSPTSEELRTYTEFKNVPRPKVLLKNAVLQPIAEIEVWLRSVPLQVQFNPPFIVASGVSKSKITKTITAYNPSSWNVEINWKGMMDIAASILCNPSSFILKPRQHFEFKISIFFQTHGKAFQDLTGMMKVCKSSTEIPCSISCSLTTNGPFIIPLTPILNFGVMKIATERMKTLAIRNTGDRAAKWVACVNGEGLVDENNRNISPFNRTLHSLRLLRVWPNSGVLEPEETLGINVYLSAEIAGEIAASVRIMVEGIPESVICIPICAEVQSPFLILEESEIILSQESLFINKVEDTTITLVNPTGYPVTFLWQSCLIGRQSQLVKAEFYPEGGYVPPRGSMDCIVIISSNADAKLENVYAMCIADAMKEPLLLKITSE